MTVDADGPDGVEALRGAAHGWLRGLDDGQRGRATFPFDADERFAWQYTPGGREGSCRSPT